MGDANAVKKGKVGRRIARRGAGKVTGQDTTQALEVKWVL